MKALFAGSFDPFTKGHLDIAQRAIKLFGNLLIGIGYNENKQGEWTVEQRVRAIGELFADNPSVEVKAYKGLTFKFAHENNVSLIVRGVRDASDFIYEKNIADINKELGNIETVFMTADPSLSFVSSSAVRELMHNGFDVSNLIAGNFPLNKG